MDGVAVDTFLVTDRSGRKLGPQGERDLRLAFEGKLRGRWAPSRLLQASEGAGEALTTRGT